MILIIFGNGVDAQVSLSSANTAVASSAKGVSALHFDVANAPVTDPFTLGLLVNQHCLGDRYVHDHCCC